MIRYFRYAEHCTGLCCVCDRVNNVEMIISTRDSRGVGVRRLMSNSVTRELGLGKEPMTLMASGLEGLGLYTEIKEPLLANYISWRTS